LHEIRLTEKNVVVAGGDARDMVLARALREMGAHVWVCGFGEYGKSPDAELEHGVPQTADVLIFPLPGLDEGGRIYARFEEEPLHISRFAPLFRPGLLVLAGRMPAYRRAELESLGVTVVLTAELDELAILNAVPTAEGAVEVAIRESDVTIRGSRALVAGFGRCGLPLAHLLAAMGAEVWVAARRREVLVTAECLGMKTVTFAELPRFMEKFHFIFNTVPAMVLSEEVLRSANPQAVIVDIASSPGGTDFYAAERLGLKSFLALGLPGKTAPVTAGKILAKVYPYLIDTHGKGGIRREA
jgi:dipicolinate synthase subunit A